MFSCEGTQNAGQKSANAHAALQGYINTGGRVFASHWHNIWLSGATNEIKNVGTFLTNSGYQNDTTTITADINQNFDKSKAPARTVKNKQGHDIQVYPRTLKEIRLSAEEAAKYNEGDVLTAADIFKEGQFVDVSGTTGTVRSVGDLFVTTDAMVDELVAQGRLGGAGRRGRRGSSLDAGGRQLPRIVGQAHAHRGQCGRMPRAALLQAGGAVRGLGAGQHRDVGTAQPPHARISLGGPRAQRIGQAQRRVAGQHAGVAAEAPQLPPQRRVEQPVGHTLVVPDVEHDQVVVLGGLLHEVAGVVVEQAVLRQLVQPEPAVRGPEDGEVDVDQVDGHGVEVATGLVQRDVDGQRAGTGGVVELHGWILGMLE